MTPQAFLDELEATKHEYDPYNIVFGDIAGDADCYFFTNDTRDARSFQQRHAALQHDKAYAVTNAPQLECAWPKASRGLQLFASILADDAARKHQAKPDAQTDVVSANSPANNTFSQQLYEQLFTQLLEDRQLVAPDDARLPVTGVAPHIEQLLSAIHVDLQPLPLAVLPDADAALAHDKQYGTVTACVAYVDAQGPCYVAERAYRHEKTPTRTIRAARQLHTPNEYCAPPISVACVDDEGRRIMSVAELRKSDSRLILVGDVHACFDELQELLLACNFDKSKDTVLLLGDLIGKGPEPKKVVEFARNGEKQGWLIALMGNWDDVALRIWRKELSYDETGDEMKAAVDALDDDDFRFLDSLPLSWCFPSLGILCVHAGIRPDLPLDKQDTNEVLNMRTLRPDGTASKQAFPDDANEPQLTHWAERYNGKFHIVYGHDATRGLVERKHTTGLDSGCVYGNQLTALIMPQRYLVQIDAIKMYSVPKPQLLPPRN